MMHKDYERKDYKDYSFAQLDELIRTLYQEIDRITAERKAASEALSELTHNVKLGWSEREVIKKSVTEGIEQALKTLVVTKKVVRSSKKKK